MEETKTSVYWKQWAKAAGIRAVKTMAQTAVAMIPVGVTVTDVGWLTVAGTALVAGILSLLTSLAGLPEVDLPEHEFDVIDRRDEGDEQAALPDTIEDEGGLE